MKTRLRILWEKTKFHWDDFFFTPVSPAAIGIFRIAIGIVAFLSVLGKFPPRETFYGTDAIITYEYMNKYLPDWPWFFRWIPLEEPGLSLYFVGFLFVIVLNIFGVWTRWTTILVWAGLVSLSNRNPHVDNAGDNLLRINYLFMIFSNAGAAYSIDRWWARRCGRAGPELGLYSPWAQRLLQLQLFYLYFQTAATKLQGIHWEQGTALYYAFGYLELRRFDFRWMFPYLWQINVLTYGTLIIEFAAGTIIWFRRFRYPVIVGIAGLHVGINLFMQFPVFQYVMLASLINFVYPEHIEMFFARLKLKLCSKTSNRKVTDEV